MSLVMGGIYDSHGSVLVHACHLLWVACTRDLVVCIYVTHCGWHILKSWWHALAYMSLAVGGMYWRHSGVFLHMCHSLWVTRTRDLMV